MISSWHGSVTSLSEAAQWICSQVLFRMHSGTGRIGLGVDAGKVGLAAHGITVE